MTIETPKSTKTFERQSAEPSSNAAEVTISRDLTVEPGQEEDDTPALHREMTRELPNDRTMFRIVESADESSNAVVQSNTNTDNDVQVASGN
jgi:hypothetical protein